MPLLRLQVQTALGPLALFNPLVPDGFYSLDLEMNDCHIVARMLTDLADVEAQRSPASSFITIWPQGANKLWGSCGSEPEECLAGGKQMATWDDVGFLLQLIATAAAADSKVWSESND